MSDAPLPFNVLCPTRYGQMLCNRHDIYIGGSIQRYGEFSEFEAALFRRLVPVGGVVVECGANIGALTVPLAQHVGREGRVIAYEPQRLAFQLLNANVALASLPNVVTRQAAVGAARARIDVPWLDPDATNNVGGLDLRAEYPAGATSEPVAMTTLDSDLSLPRLDLLKADVEGAELDVLLGARETIAAHRPVVYLEWDRADQRQAVVDVLRVYGYPLTRLYVHLPPLFNPSNHAGKADNVFVQDDKAVVSVNLLAFHSSVEDLPALGDVPDLRPLAGAATEAAATA